MIQAVPVSDALRGKTPFEEQHPNADRADPVVSAGGSFFIDDGMVEPANPAEVVEKTLK